MTELNPGQTCSDPRDRRSSSALVRRLPGTLPLLIGSLFAGQLCGLAAAAQQAPFQPAVSPLRTSPAAQPSPVAQPGTTAQPGRRLSLNEVFTDLYVLGPGDGLSLNFLDPAAKSLGGSFGILLDGTTSLPLLGSVQLSGLTIGQATRWLTSLYGKQLVRPQLYLTLVNPRPAQVTIIGEVERPGLYPLGGVPTVVTAIKTAGGITALSDVRNVVLRRLAGPDGIQKETILDLTQVFMEGNQLQNPILFDGDTLIVKRSTKPIPQGALELGATNLAPESISVNIIGEVKSPGSVSMPANTPLVEAIFRAGGPVRWRANTNNVQLVRFNRDGKVTIDKYSYRKFADLSLQNPPLKNGDTIIVNSSVFGKAMDAFNDIAVPIGIITNLTNLYNTYYWGWGNNNNR